MEEEKEDKEKSELALSDLSRCAACYSHMPRRNDHGESSSSEDSEHEPNCESSSCSSSDEDFEELKSPDISHLSVAPSLPVLETEEPEGDTAQSSQTKTRAVALSPKCVLQPHWPQPPKIVSVLNLQVFPPRHSYDPHYTIRRCPSDTEISTQARRRETGHEMNLTEAEQTPHVQNVTPAFIWPQQLSDQPVLHYTPSSYNPSLHHSVVSSGQPPHHCASSFGQSQSLLHNAAMQTSAMRHPPRSRALSKTWS